LFERGANVAYPVGRSALNLNHIGMLRVADNRADGDAGLLQLALNAGGVGIGGSADRLLDVYLQNKMRAAAEVETEIDAAVKALLQAGRA
jgi:hypothetical protein